MYKNFIVDSAEVVLTLKGICGQINSKSTFVSVDWWLLHTSSHKRFVMSENNNTNIFDNGIYVVAGEYGGQLYHSQNGTDIHKNTQV